MQSTNDVDNSSHLGVHVLIALLIGVAVGFGNIVGDWVSAGFLFLVIFMAYIGYWSGGVKIASSVLSLLAAIRFAPTFSPYVAEWCDELVAIPDAFREPISLVGAGILTALVVVITLRVTASFVFQSKPGWKHVNRWFGLAAGLVQGVVIGAIILLGIGMLEPIAKQQLASRGRAKVGGFVQQWPGKVVAFSKTIKESTIGKAVEPMQDRFRGKLDKMSGAMVSQTDNDGSLHRKLMKMVKDVREDPTSRKHLARTLGVDEGTLQNVFESPKFDKTLRKVSSFSEVAETLNP